MLSGSWSQRSKGPGGLRQPGCVMHHQALVNHGLVTQFLGDTASAMFTAAASYSSQLSSLLPMFTCVRVCVRACARPRVRACVRVLRACACACVLFSS